MATPREAPKFASAMSSTAQPDSARARSMCCRAVASGAGISFSSFRRFVAGLEDALARELLDRNERVRGREVICQGPSRHAGQGKPWPVLARPPSVLWNREFMATDRPWRRTDRSCTFAKNELLVSTANDTNAK